MPDLAVEVDSPNDLYTDVHAKVLDWLATGGRMVVVLDGRKRAVTAYCSRTDITVLTEEDTRDGADVVPGWRIAVRDLST